MYRLFTTDGKQVTSGLFVIKYVPKMTFKDKTPQIFNAEVGDKGNLVTMLIEVDNKCGLDMLARYKTLLTSDKDNQLIHPYPVEGEKEHYLIQFPFKITEDQEIETRLVPFGGFPMANIASIIQDLKLINPNWDKLLKECYANSCVIMRKRIDDEDVRIKKEEKANKIAKERIEAKRIEAAANELAEAERSKAEGEWLDKAWSALPWYAKWGKDDQVWIKEKRFEMAKRFGSRWLVFIGEDGDEMKTESDKL